MGEKQLDLFTLPREPEPIRHLEPEPESAESGESRLCHVGNIAYAQHKWNKAWPLVTCERCGESILLKIHDKELRAKYERQTLQE